MIDRRNLLKLGALAGAAAFVPLERLTAAPASAASAAASPPVPLFDLPLAIPPVLKPRNHFGPVDYYDVTMREADVEVLRGVKSRLWTYNGSFPGPTIKARAGRPVVIRQHNKLSEPTAVHLHGANVPSSSDGLPGDEIMPGGARDYFYPNRQQATTLWYHDHVHHLESAHTYKGLTGLYVISDRAEENLRLPEGRYDIPLVLQDRLFNADGTLRLPAQTDLVGDVNLVNGKPFPVLEVEQRPYRFRVLNGSSLDGILDLSLSSGEPFQVIGSDGGLLAETVPVQHIPLSPSERVELVIDFSKYRIGTQIELKNNAVAGGLSGHVMRFDVTHRPRSHVFAVPKRLVPVPKLRESSARVRREFTFKFNPVAFQMEINGKSFDPNRIDIKPRLGDTEIWTVTNGEQQALPIPHVFHTHLVRFQVLARNGQPPGPLETGWKDSILIPAGEQVRLIMKFGDFTGRYLYHCHLLAHADLGMMAQMEVVRH